MPFLRSHRHELDQLIKQMFQKDTETMATSGTAEDQQSVFLGLFGGVKPKLWDVDVPPLIGPHKEPGLLLMSPRYISSPSLLPVVWQPYKQERRNLQHVPISLQASLTLRCLLYIWPRAGPWEDSHSLPHSRFHLMFPGLWGVLLRKTTDETSGRLHICCNSDYLHAALGLGSFQSWMDRCAIMYILLCLSESYWFICKLSSTQEIWICCFLLFLILPALLTLLFWDHHLPTWLNCPQTPPTNAVTERWSLLEI